MTVLQSLARHYERLAARGDAPEYGYSKEPVSFAMVLSREGHVVDVADLRDTSGKKPRPSRKIVPRPAPRASNIAPNFLWDKTAYSLGFKFDEAQGKAVVEKRGEHTAFRNLHMSLLDGSNDEGLSALLRFLDGWQAKNFSVLRYASEMAGANIVFRLDGEQRFIHQLPAAIDLWRAYLNTQSGTTGLCLVTGQHLPMERLHPKIKGVFGAQSSGASMASFNLDAFESFGKKQGANAPVSEQAAFAYTTALNALLAPNSAGHVRIGDATAVFWAEARGGEAGAAATEYVLSALLSGPPTDEQEAARVSAKLSAIAEGRPLEDASIGVDGDTRIFVLGISPNASRLSVRFWHEDSIGEIVRRAVEHWHDLHIEPSPWSAPPAVWRILYETAAQRKAENIPPILGGALMRAILSGGRYPHTLLAAVVARMRADKNVTGPRVAICKACLARDHRLGFEKEDIPVSLNTEESSPAYRLGRLFAVYEGVQHAAMGNVNATIKDRYFGAASATPASVFPLLERSSVNHLASLRKGDKGGLAHWFEREIDAILDGMDSAFPRSLRLQEQGRFAIGYHHQRASKKADRKSSGDAGVPNNKD